MVDPPARKGGRAAARGRARAGATGISLLPLLFRLTARGDEDDDEDDISLDVMLEPPDLSQSRR